MQNNKETYSLDANSGVERMQIGMDKSNNQVTSSKVEYSGKE